MSLEYRTIPVALGRLRITNEPSETLNGQTFAEKKAYQTPLIDIHEGPEGLILEADLPGATEDNVSIQLEQNVLSLHARVSNPAPEGARMLHEEYQILDYYRSFILSDEVERSKIAAELKNGVLRLTLPKAERAKTRRIEIKS